MAKTRVSRLICIVAATMIAACAHQPEDPIATMTQADTPDAAIDPSNPADIMMLGERLTHHRLALFSVTQGKYTFYVGGVLSAGYETTTGILRISSLTPEDKTVQTCEYSPQGVLFVDPKDQVDKEAFVSGCRQLVRRLTEYLSR